MPSLWTPSIGSTGEHQIEILCYQGDEFYAAKVKQLQDDFHY
jgi:hypothetical protein